MYKDYEDVLIIYEKLSIYIVCPFLYLVTYNTTQTQVHKITTLGL